MSVARLVVVQGDASLRELPLTDVCVLGRGDGCSIVLLDGAASRRHAQVDGSGGMHVLTDLDSTNGTFLNGKRVRRAPLADGDEIAIGGVRIRYRAALPAETFVVGGLPSGRSEQTAPAPSPIGRSAAFLLARSLAERAATSDLPVLLRGETGTGKEVFARLIHDRSKRASGPFLALHAAAIPATLFEAELFGHERGAFTGAEGKRDGFLARAHGGTLFLDEVGELPAEAQAKLLRVLETGEFHPIGSSATRRSDFRLIAATNRELDRAVREGLFRSDLLFRLNAIEIRLPALRDRLDDLPLFVEAWLRASGKRASPELLEALRSRAWPGNLRELRHVVDRAVLLAEGDDLSLEDLPIAEAAPEEAGNEASLDAAERRAIEAALAKTGGKRGEAARLLGIAEPTLRRKLRRYGLG